VLVATLVNIAAGSLVAALSIPFDSLGSANLCATIAMLVLLLLNGALLNLKAAPPLIAAVQNASFFRFGFQALLGNELHNKVIVIDAPGRSQPRATERARGGAVRPSAQRPAYLPRRAAPHSSARCRRRAVPAECKPLPLAARCRSVAAAAGHACARRVCARARVARRRAAQAEDDARGSRAVLRTLQPPVEEGKRQVGQVYAARVSALRGAFANLAASTWGPSIMLALAASTSCSPRTVSPNGNTLF